MLDGSTLPQTESPPDSPSLPATQQLLNSVYAEKVIALFSDIAKAVQHQNPSASKNVPAVRSSTPLGSLPTITRVQASKPDYRTVHEVWDNRAYKYKVIESSAAKFDQSSVSSDRRDIFKSKLAIVQHGSP
ncbi:hypothetical protein MMC30_009116 [Trapelia coarctata]|nr:hypothetical protein [Trapelia coarctata]